ncbi:MAG: polyribonucleotide nucleotidyltransferase [Candidatus Parcubacteria bacterium]|nr:MAG: polyribonucleotide nucleotidyltransferase [Candidatus Parcubacteria bacterium]
MKKFSLNLDKSRKIILDFEINDWAQRANISLLTKCFDSVVLTTIVIGEKKEIIDFVPLTIDYDEKYYAAGKIYGSRFLRREGKPSETAILNARLIDRGLRPAIKSFPYEIQIVNTVLSLDQEFDPDILAFFGSSVGFHLLGYKWLGPVIPIKISKFENKFIFYPKESEKNFSDFNIFISGMKGKINMIEFEGLEIPEDEVINSCKLALDKITEIEKELNIFLTDIKLKNNNLVDIGDLPKFYLSYGESFLQQNKIDIEGLIFNNQEKTNIDEVFKILEEKKDNLENYNYIYYGILEKIKNVFQTKILKNKIRPDGRKLDEIRKIDFSIDVLPRAHGSAIFKRGLTHVLSTVTLGSLSDDLLIKEIEFEGSKRFLHHYNFPPYSTGEIGPLRSPSRREIGHGNLVEKSLKNLIPQENIFPYTIRIVSDVLSSNGSTSMGSVCSSTLALLSAGVPIKNKCAGISIGIVYQDDNNFELLTDIQGPEDFWGGMDFKVAGTDKGITAIQLDVKIEGLNLDIIEKTLRQALKARLFIIDKFNEVIKEPKKELKENVPRNSIFKINADNIGLLIGPGGRTINEIIALTNAKIDIKQDGLIYLTAENQQLLDRTINLIKLATNEINVGDILEGQIIKILDFGFIIDLGLNKTALLHISDVPKNNFENFTLDKVVRVRVKKINEQGRIYVNLANE